MTFEEAIIAVWHQSLVEKARGVNLDGDEFPVRSPAKQKLKQVDFRFDGRDLRALEQNPNTKSRWAAMARKGQKVMQFLENGKYLTVVADGKVHLYEAVQLARVGLSQRPSTNEEWVVCIPCSAAAVVEAF